MPTIATELRILVYEGNVKGIPFRFRVKGTKFFWDVSASSEIRLEYEKNAGQEQAFVVCNPLHPDADFVNGKVIAPISPSDLTGEVGSYPFALTVFMGTDVITAVTGHIEVAERPGFPFPPPPPEITSSLAVSGSLTVAFAYQIVATNNPTSYSATGLPPGLAVNSATGLIFGTPTTAGVYNVSIGATNVSGTDTETLVITIV